MCTESDQAVNNRASCFLNMNDSRNQNSFDFVPKSDYNEKWHLENKCLFHNQQVNEKQNSSNTINVLSLIFTNFCLVLTIFSFSPFIFFSLYQLPKGGKICKLYVD